MRSKIARGLRQAVSGLWSRWGLALAHMAVVKWLSGKHSNH